MKDLVGNEIKKGDGCSRCGEVKDLNIVRHCLECSKKEFDEGVKKQNKT